MAHEPLVEQWQDPLALATCLLQIRLLHSELRVRAIGVGAKWCRVDAEQQLTRLHRLAFRVPTLEQDARHARAYLHFAYATQLRGVLEGERQLARLHL